MVSKTFPGTGGHCHLSLIGLIQVIEYNVGGSLFIGAYLAYALLIFLQFYILPYLSMEENPRMFAKVTLIC